MEQHTVISSSLSAPEIQDLSCSSWLPSNQSSTGCVLHNSMLSLILSSSLNENSYRKSIANYIGMLCKDVPV